MEVLGAYLVLLVFAAHVICVCFMCGVGCLVHTWCKRGVAFVKFPSPMELWDLYIFYGTCMHRLLTLEATFRLYI